MNEMLTPKPSASGLCIQPLLPGIHEYRPDGFVPVPGKPWTIGPSTEGKGDGVPVLAGSVAGSVEGVVTTVIPQPLRARTKLNAISREMRLRTTWFPPDPLSDLLGSKLAQKVTWVDSSRSPAAGVGHAATELLTGLSRR